MARKKQNSSDALPHGRKRVLSPGFFTDADLLTQPALYRIFFEGLWCFADREGRLLDKPIDLKVKILPNDQIDPFAAVKSLASRGLLARYAGPDGRRFLALKPKPWKQIQRIHPEEPESAIPPPPDGCFAVPDDGYGADTGISVHGNPPPTPISPAGSSGSSCLRDPRAFVPSGSSGPSLLQEVPVQEKPATAVAPASRRKPKPPEQPELPAIPPPPPPPPRALSRQEEAADNYRETRITVLEELGLPESADESFNPGFLNLALGPILDAVEPHARGKLTGWDRLLDLWFRQSWAADKAPPFPLRMFLSCCPTKPTADGKPPRPGLIDRMIAGE